MILFGLSVLFVLSVSAFVAQEMRQDVSITFLILLIVFSGMTYKRRVNNELKILKSSMEVSFIYESMKIGGITHSASARILLAGLCAIDYGLPYKATDH
jgi:hypothetical protein